MREHDALGAPGRARGIDEGGKIGGARSRGERRLRRLFEPCFERHRRNGGIRIVAEFIVRNDDELQIRELTGFADLTPLELLVGDENLGARVVEDVGRGLRRVDGVKRHGREGVRKDRLVEEHRFHAVGQEHRHARPAFKPHAGECVTPALHFVVRLAEGPVAPSLLLRIPRLPANGSRTLFNLEGEHLGNCGEHIQIADALKAFFLTRHGVHLFGGIRVAEEIEVLQAQPRP